MQVKADPNSLCGVSVIDRSILVKEPGKILDEDKVTAGIKSKMHCFLWYHRYMDVAGLSLEYSSSISNNVIQVEKIIFLFPSWKYLAM